MAIISASDLKTHMNVAVTDSVDETSFTLAAASSCVWVQQTCGRSFEVTTSGSESSRVFRPRTPRLTIIDDFSTTTSLAVKTDFGDDGVYETSLTLNTDYFVEPFNGVEDGLTQPYRKIRAKSWLFPMCNVSPSVQVTARWGWTAVPDAVKQAALYEGARLFKRRTSPEGMHAGFADFGGFRVSNQPDPDAVDLLKPYVRSETSLLT